MKYLLKVFTVLSMLVIFNAFLNNNIGYANSKQENRLAGNVVFFDNNEHLNCAKKIIAYTDGMITAVDDYEPGVDGVTYLSDNLVIYPGLIDLHSHCEANMYQLFTDVVKETAMWDNRFEFRKSAPYFKYYKAPNASITKEWDKALGAEPDALTVGEMVYLYSELQAVAGGTVLLQEDGNNMNHNYLNCHRSIKMVRSTADREDIFTDKQQAIESYIQLYTPDRLMSPDDFSSYAPPQVTDWPIKNQMMADNKKTCLENIIDQIKEDKGSQGYLIHLAEGRNGNLKAAEGMDAFCKNEFAKFKSELEAYVANGTVTKAQIRAANITLIHGCGIDLSDAEIYEFIKDYGIGIVWSPVSNLLLYGDTPKFYDYLGDASINVVIGSDWSPSGSKTVWDECKFALAFIDKRKNIDRQKLEAEVFKAANINAAKAVGLDKMGNIKKANCADFMIINTGINDSSNSSINAGKALDSFFNTSEKDVAAVYVGGKVIYAGKTYIDAYLGNDGYAWCSTDTTANNSLEPKYYNLMGVCKAGTFFANFQSFTDLIITTYGSISSLKSYDDLKYQRTISDLAKQYCQ